MSFAGRSKIKKEYRIALVQHARWGATCAHCLKYVEWQGPISDFTKALRRHCVPALDHYFPDRDKNGDPPATGA